MEHSGKISEGLYKHNVPIMPFGALILHTTIESARELECKLGRTIYKMFTVIAMSSNPFRQRGGQRQDRAHPSGVLNLLQECRV